MTDLKKVIKGLEIVWDAFNHMEHEMYADYVYDALALLKAQEPVEPVVDIDTYKCGNCGHTLEHQELLGDNVLFHEQYNYCPECGKKVKWDG